MAPTLPASVLYLAWLHGNTVPTLPKENHRVSKQLCLPMPSRGLLPGLDLTSSQSPGVSYW